LIRARMWEMTYINRPRGMLGLIPQTMATFETSHVFRPPGAGRSIQSRGPPTSNDRNAAANMGLPHEVPTATPSRPAVAMACAISWRILERTVSK
jgi:hypothetical protein